MPITPCPVTLGRSYSPRIRKSVWLHSFCNKWRGAGCYFFFFLMHGLVNVYVSLSSSSSIILMLKAKLWNLNLKLCTNCLRKTWHIFVYDFLIAFCFFLFITLLFLVPHHPHSLLLPLYSVVDSVPMQCLCRGLELDCDETNLRAVPSVSSNVTLM